MPSLQLVSELPGHTDPAWCVAWNPKRPILASCSTDKTVRLYSYTLPQATPASLETRDEKTPRSSGYSSATASKADFSLLSVVSTEHKRTIRSVAWNPAGTSFATGSFDSAVAVWEEVDGADGDGDEDESEDGEEGVYRPKRAEHAHGPGCNHSHSHDGEDRDETDERDFGPRKAKEWECVTTLEGHESECKSVGWSPEGGLLASCSRDKSVWVWEVQPDDDFECIAVMMEHTQDVKCLAWHPKEEILASASYDSHIHLMFDDPDGDWCPFQKLHPKLPAAPLTIPSSSRAVFDAMRPDGMSIDPQNGGSGSADVADAEKKAEELVVPPLQEDETVWALAWSPDGRFLASGGDNGGVRLWERTGHHPDSPLVELLHTAAHSRACFSLSWTEGGLSPSEGGLGLLASSGGDGRIIVWQITEAVKSATEDGEQAPTSLSSDEPRIRIAPVAAVREAHGVSDVNALQWCPRGEGKGRGLLASCGDDGTVKVWRVVSE